MKLIIMRHGESEADILHVIEGRADFDLTERGVQQVTKAAKGIHNQFHIDRIYSSTLQRARHTALLLQKEVNAPIIFRDDLKEFNNGLIAGLSFAEADLKYPKVENLPFDQAVYGMESQMEFRLRADEALRNIIEDTKEEETIAIVSHGKMIDRLYQAFCQMMLQVESNYWTDDAGVHIWEISQGKRTDITSQYVHKNTPE